MKHVTGVCLTQCCECRPVSITGCHYQWPAKHLELTATASPNDRYELLVHTAPTTNDSHRLTMYQLTACYYLKQELSSS